MGWARKHILGELDTDMGIWDLGIQSRMPPFLMIHKILGVRKKIWTHLYQNSYEMFLVQNIDGYGHPPPRGCHA